MADKKLLFPIFSQAAKRDKKAQLREEEGGGGGATTQQTQPTPVAGATTGGAADSSKKRKSSAGGGNSSTPASAPRTQGSSFVVCPVCFGSVPRALVDAHVAGCLALQRQAQMEATAGGGGGRGTAEEQKQQQRRPPQPLPAAAVAETATTTALATTTKAAAPAGEQQQALRSLSQVLRPQPRAGSAKASAAAASAPSAPAPAPQKRQAAAAAAAPPPLSRRAPTPQPPPTAATAAAVAGGASAFAELMRAQRSASTTHVFSLVFRGDSFFWHWSEVTGGGGGGGRGAAAGAGAGATASASASGPPPAAWTAELSIPLPWAAAGASSSSFSRQKVAVRLETNLPPGSQQQLGSREPWPPRRPGAAAAGDAAPAPPPRPPPQPPVFPRLAPSLLKSALQKNVRLGRAAAAVRVAAHLIRQGEAGELLRRLPVIALEDACLTPALPLAVWMMAAFSKGWDPLPAAAERAILKFVHSLACSRIRDDPELFEEEEEDEDGEEEEGRSGAGAKKRKRKKLEVASLFASSSSRPALDPQASLLIRVLHLRAAFGGMPCDVAMMRAAADTWLRRFAGRGGTPPGAAAAGAEANRGEAWLSFLWRSFSPPSVPPLLLDPSGATGSSSSVGRMTQEDVPLSAVDFHVSSVSEELMNLPAVAREAGKAARAVGESENDAEERLRRAMWLFRSSRNVRSPIGGSGSSASATAAAPPTSTSAAAAAPAPAPPAAPVVLNGDSARARALRAQSASERDDLRPLWRAAAAAADSWSAEFLRHRFRARGRF